MVAVGYSTVGAIVASRLPHSPIGWLFCAIALCFGVDHFSAEYAAYALLEPSGSLPAGEAFAWLTSWVWVFGLGLVVFLDLLFAQRSLAVVLPVHGSRAPTGSDLGGVIS